MKEKRPFDNLYHPLLKLTRIARRRPETRCWLEDATKSRLSELVDLLVQVATGEGDPIGQVAAAHLESNPNLTIATRLSQIIPERTTSLRELAIISLQQVIDALRENPQRSETELAAQLTRLSKRHADASQHEAALRASQEAVRIFRSLERSEIYLAVALSIMASNLHAMALPQEAVEAATEAASISRRFAARGDSIEGERAGASALTTLAAIRLNIGQYEEALEAINEIIDKYNATEDSDTAAVSLEDLRQIDSTYEGYAATLGHLGFHEEALDAWRRIVQRYRLLAANNPDAYLPDLARALNNSASSLASLRDNLSAYTNSQEAVDIYRNLTNMRQETFQVDFSTSLIGLSAIASNTGKSKIALEAALEAAEICKALIERQGDAFMPNLASSLHNYAKALNDSGRYQEMIGPFRDAASIYRKLAANSPETYSLGLALCLSGLSVAYFRLEQHEESIRSCTEAVEQFRGLTARHPTAFRSYLAESLSRLAQVLTYTGRHLDAIEPAKQARDVYRDLAVEAPHRHNVPFAESLAALARICKHADQYEEAVTNIEASLNVLDPSENKCRKPLANNLTLLAETLREMGRHSQAYPFSKRAHELYQELPAERLKMARNLDCLTGCLCDLGRFIDALPAIREAIAIHRSSKESDDPAWQANLAGYTMHLSHVLTSLHKYEEAAAAANVAIDIYRELSKLSPDGVNPVLGGSLSHLSDILSHLNNQRNCALESAEQATAIFRELAAHDNDTFAPELARSVSILAKRLGELGRDREALARAKEAIVTLTPFFIDAPRDYRRWMSDAVESYKVISAKLSSEPEEGVLEPVRDALLEGEGNNSLGDRRNPYNRAYWLSPDRLRTIRRRLAAPDSEFEDLLSEAGRERRRILDRGIWRP